VPCPIFTGIDRRPRRIHEALLQRTNACVLIDNSKTLAWAHKQVVVRGVPKQYIHLLRDPRAVVYAWGQRNLDKGLDDWIEENRRIRDFLVMNRCDYVLATYDQLTLDTTNALRGLCSWLGLTFLPSQIEYWHFEHHGSGRNGATAAFLERYRTPDQAFYETHRRTQFRDLRWVSGLDPAIRGSIEQDARLRDFLHEVGLRLGDDGLAPNEGIS
jgi:hypothetical protein